MKQQIFKLKKLKRKGMFEKKRIRHINKIGRWTNLEHYRFFNASLKYGCNWKKVIF
jgi:hypothetical protein